MNINFEKAAQLLSIISECADHGPPMNWLREAAAAELNEMAPKPEPVEVPEPVELEDADKLPPPPNGHPEVRRI